MEGDIGSPGRENMNIKHLEVKRAYYADPENVVVEFWSKANLCWKSCIDEPAWYEYYDYRIKPKTIRIGDLDVPEPVRAALERGQKYWIVYFYGVGALACEATWNGDRTDDGWLSRGMIHLTREAADLHAKALILVSGGKVDE